LPRSPALIFSSPPPSFRGVSPDTIHRLLCRTCTHLIFKKNARTLSSPEKATAGAGRHLTI
jgi:hypothetical protein